MTNLKILLCIVRWNGKLQIDSPQSIVLVAVPYGSANLSRLKKRCSCGTVEKNGWHLTPNYVCARSHICKLHNYIYTYVTGSGKRAHLA